MYKNKTKQTVTTTHQFVLFLRFHNTLHIFRRSNANVREHTFSGAEIDSDKPQWKFDVNNFF